MENSIVYYNYSSGRENNYTFNCKATYSCIRPLVPGVGNIDDIPQLVSLNDPYPFAGSPCIDRIIPDMMDQGMDVAGSARKTGSRLDIGAYEYNSGDSTDLSTLILTAKYARVSAEYSWEASVVMGGRARSLIWDFGDGDRELNLFSVSHRYTTTGVYQVVVTAENGWKRLSVTSVVEVVQAPMFYVSLSGNHVFPFSSYVNAATNINDAVEATLIPGSIVEVDSGIYDSGYRVAGGTSRVYVSRPVILRGRTGNPNDVVIKGVTNEWENTRIRAVYLCRQSRIESMTLTDGCPSGDPMNWTWQNYACLLYTSPSPRD